MVLQPFLWYNCAAVPAAATRLYGAGDFLSIPAEHPHFGGATGHTIIQLHGVGPFEILMADE